VEQHLGLCLGHLLRECRSRRYARAVKSQVRAQKKILPFDHYYPKPLPTSHNPAIRPLPPKAIQSQAANGGCKTRGPRRQVRRPYQRSAFVGPDIGGGCFFPGDQEDEMGFNDQPPRDSQTAPAWPFPSPPGAAAPASPSPPWTRPSGAPAPPWTSLFTSPAPHLPCQLAPTQVQILGPEHPPHPHAVLLQIRRNPGPCGGTPHPHPHAVLLPTRLNPDPWGRTPHAVLLPALPNRDPQAENPPNPPWRAPV
jgi:hypothetical protein